MPVNLISKIEPKNNGLFPMLEDIHIEGGYQIREDINDRDSIPDLNRKEGMLVFVESDSTTYRLVGGTDNLSWTPVVDSLRLGYKNPARAASTQNIANLASGAPSQLDGVSLSSGDRTLVYRQINKATNGIYNVDVPGTGSDGQWSRANDADIGDRLIPGSEIYIVEGGQATTKFWLITPGPITVGTTPLDFVGGLSVMTSDNSPFSILSSSELGSSDILVRETDSFSVRGFKEADISFTVDDLGLSTEIRLRVLYSLLETPSTYSANSSHWNILLSESIDGGLATADPYTVSLNATAYPGFSSLPGSFAIRAPVSGLHMMLLIWSEVGDPTGSDVSAIALRRI